MSVNLVPVLVVLRKANGEAVGNLPKESFQLFDNGKPQAITRFAVESPGGPRSSVNEPSSTAGAAGGTEAPNSEAPRSVAYIFDDLHLASADLGRARDAAAEELAKLTAVDHAAVFATSGEGSVDFTSDRDKLQSALRGLKSHADQDAGGCPPMTYYEAEEIVNRSDTSALSLAMADTMECAHTTRQDEARRLAESAAFDVLSRGQMESRRALDTLRTVLSRVALMPGERSTVLVSPGFLTTVADLREKAMSLIANAVQDGVVVNVLDATGLTVTGVSANRSHSTDAVEQSQLENNDILERSELLADLAYGTGGIFFHNNNDLKEGFRRTSEPPEFVYVLGFAPQKLDGKFHKLKVKVANRNLTVQARQGYYAHE